MRLATGFKFVTLLSFFVLLNAPLWAQTTSVEMVGDTTGTAAGKISRQHQRPWPVSKYTARAGGFWAISSTGVSMGTARNPSSIIDLENDLGMNRNTASLLLNFDARYGRHHRVDLSYYYINRRSSKTLNKEITFKDQVYPVNTEVDAFLNTGIIRVSYGFSFISNSHFEVGALIGAHVMVFDMGLKAAGNSAQLNYNGNANFTAPLPDLGVWGTYAFCRNWAVSTELSYFSVKIDNVKGRILSGALSVKRKLGEHWGLDLGYTLFDVKVTLDRPHLKGDFNWSYSGPSLAANYRFGHFKKHVK